MIQLYLDSIGDKAGNYKVKLKTYDDSTAAKGAWDDAARARRTPTRTSPTPTRSRSWAPSTPAAPSIEVPVLNQDPTADADGVAREHQPRPDQAVGPGRAGQVLPDRQAQLRPCRHHRRLPGHGGRRLRVAGPEGQERATSSTTTRPTAWVSPGRSPTQAKKDGIKVLGNDAWDAKRTNYTALFQKIKRKNPDCVYLGGIYDNNGGQLVKDKVAVLGDNTKVKLIVPDGFTGYPDLDKLPQSQGMYLTFAGLTQSELLSRQAARRAKLLAAYKAKYGHAPAGSYPLYGVAAVQVILAAIAKSDGTRAGRHDAGVQRLGHHHPGRPSR